MDERGSCRRTGTRRCTRYNCALITQKTVHQILIYRLVVTADGGTEELGRGEAEQGQAQRERGRDGRDDEGADEEEHIVVLPRTSEGGVGLVISRDGEAAFPATRLVRCARCMLLHTDRGVGGRCHPTLILVCFVWCLLSRVDAIGLSAGEITRVARDDAAGRQLRAGDIVVGVDGQSVDGKPSIIAAIKRKDAGGGSQPVRLKIHRAHQVCYRAHSRPHTGGTGWSRLGLFTGHD